MTDISKIKWSAPIGGSMEIYKQLRRLDLHAGDLVRISGLTHKKVILPISYAEGVGFYVQIGLENEKHWLGDNGNGMFNHNWKYQFPVPEPTLPTEPGLYQIVDYAVHLDVEYEVTYRLGEGKWTTALYNEPVAPSGIERLETAHAEGRLYRLVREKA